MSDKLSIYGTAFQVKVLSSLLTDLKFLQTSSDILNGDIFDSDSNKWLVNEIVDYFLKHKTIPTLDVLKILFISPDSPAIIAPTIITDEIALVTDIKGV